MTVSSEIIDLIKILDVLLQEFDEHRWKEVYFDGRNSI